MSDTAQVEVAEPGVIDEEKFDEQTNKIEDALSELTDEITNIESARDDINNAIETAKEKLAAIEDALKEVVNLVTEDSN